MQLSFRRPLDLKLYRSITPISDFARGGVTVPFSYRLRKRDAQLLMIGVEHKRDLTDAQLPYVEREFASFLQDRPSGACVVAVEGLVPPKESLANEETAVQRFGEGGYAAFLGSRQDIAIISIEPAQAEVIGWVRDLGHADIDIASWGLLNVLTALGQPDGTFGDKTSEALAGILNQMARTMDLAGKGAVGPLAAEKAYELLRDRILGTDVVSFTLPGQLKGFDGARLDVNGIARAQHPTIRVTKFNEIADAMNTARDYGMVLNVLAQLDQDKNVFAVFGANHAYCQREAYLTAGLKK